MSTRLNLTALVWFCSVCVAADISKEAGGQSVSEGERATWADGPSSALRGATLGLLVGREEPIHGYKLGTLLDRHLGPAWRIDPKNVYALLDGLEREGLVRTRTVPGGDRRPGKSYEATEQADLALDEWMRASVDAVPRRVELQARIAVSREHDIPSLERALDEYERSCFRLLSKTDLPEVPMVSWRAASINITRKADSLHLRAELEWIESAREWIGDWRRRRPQRHAPDRDA